MEDKYEALKLKNQLCYPLYICAKELQRRYTPFLSKLDLTYSQYVVMMYFWENGSSNVRTVARTLLLDPSTLTPMLKKLEAKGYVIRSRSERDERNLIVSLTESGEKLKDLAVDIPCEVGKCLGLSGEEAAELYRILYKLLQNIEKEL